MLDVIQRRQAGVKILMGVILGMICIAMVITLVPGLIPGTTSGMTSADTIARVGTEDISRQDVESMLNRELRGQQLPPSFKSLYAKQVLDQLISEKSL